VGSIRQIAFGQMLRFAKVVDGRDGDVRARSFFNRVEENLARLLLVHRAHADAEPVCSFNLHDLKRVIVEHPGCVRLI
jgi:hypothetical protein